MRHHIIIDCHAQQVRAVPTPRLQPSTRQFRLRVRAPNLGQELHGTKRKMKERGRGLLRTQEMRIRPRGDAERCKAKRENNR